jgi:predicted Zn-dependent protease
MPGDRFDRLAAVGLLLVLVALGVLVATAGSSTGRPADGSLDRRVEQELLAQARVAFLERHYGPVAALRDRGELQSALLKLEELERQFPGEPHGALLRGDVLYRMGLIDRAVSSLAAAVRGNGDYLDPGSPLNQRDLIAVTAEQGVPLLRDRVRGQPDDRQAAATLKEAYYLQSRLAGGCE